MGDVAPRPHLSVVVPTHQTRELTLRALGALAACAPAPDEVIVVDDGSTDGTGDAVRARHPTAKVLTLGPARGFTAAANRGMAEASGDLLFLLNSDTEVEAHALARLRAAFTGDPKLGVAGAELAFPDGTPQWSGGPAPTALWLFALASGAARALARLPGYRRLRPPGGGPGGVDWVSGAAMVVRREAWQAAGGFDERFHFYCQDLDLCLRVLAAGFTVAVVPGARVMHRAGATIGQRAGSLGDRSHPALLWTDLVRWAAKQRGAAAARHAARVLRLGGALRVGARRLALPFLGRARRADWRRDTHALEAALAALGRERPAPR